MFSCELLLCEDETYRGLNLVMMPVSFRLIRQRSRQDRNERDNFACHRQSNIRDLLLAFITGISILNLIFILL